MTRSNNGQRLAAAQAKLAAAKSSAERAEDERDDLIREVAKTDSQISISQATGLTKGRVWQIINRRR